MAQIWGKWKERGCNNSEIQLRLVGFGLRFQGLCKFLAAPNSSVNVLGYALLVFSFQETRMWFSAEQCSHPASYQWKLRGTVASLYPVFSLSPPAHHFYYNKLLYILCALYVYILLIFTPSDKGQINKSLKDHFFFTLFFCWGGW